MSGPTPASGPMPTGSPRGASVSTNAERRPWNDPLLRPSLRALRGLLAVTCQCLLAAAQNIKMIALALALPGPSWPQASHTPPSTSFQNKTPSKIDGVCQRSDRGRDASVFHLAFYSLLATRLYPNRPAACASSV